MSIMQRNKINQILRSGKSLPKSMNKKKSAANGFPAVDIMRDKNARRRTLDSIVSSGVYERAKYSRKFPSIVPLPLDCSCTKFLHSDLFRSILRQMI